MSAAAAVRENLDNNNVAVAIAAATSSNKTSTDGVVDQESGQHHQQQQQQLPKSHNNDHNCKISDEEKIFVTVRLRPLSDRETSRNDFSAWECSNGNTIAYAFGNERSSYPPHSYSFDRVFGAETTNREVYEKGAKDVTMSAMAGKNATIFAYGQTSSGKTYTMQGITESVTDDIFTYIKQNDDRVYLLKFSALEIYNEVATDLLNPDTGSLRLLDDPERGTIVEKLEEKIVQDKDHLLSFLALCDAHRQVGETSLNERSSRSHLIIRLSIESSSRVVAEDVPAKSLIAILNFVDLAGSERASLIHSDGSRLKEGCYINRSLLTLGTVIRKLSDSNRMKVGHVPYRDSKLTRILQHSLGGNARTAIICTISASNRHVEQTKNTLLFASCAMEVTNRAQVNTVISDKELIKQLKREVALLEAKLRLSTYSTRGPSPTALMEEKDQQIQKMQDEMREALQQRDHAQSQLDGVLKQMEASEQARALVLSKICGEDISLSRSCDEESTSTTTTTIDGQQQLLQVIKDDGIWRNVRQQQHHSMINGTTCSTSPKTMMNAGCKSASALLLQEIYKLEHLQNELTQDANRALLAAQKEVEILRLPYNHCVAESVAKLQAEMNEINYNYESRRLSVASLAAATSGQHKDQQQLQMMNTEGCSTCISTTAATAMAMDSSSSATSTERPHSVEFDKFLATMRVSIDELSLMPPKLTPPPPPAMAMATPPPHPRTNNNHMMNDMCYSVRSSMDANNINHHNQQQSALVSPTSLTSTTFSSPRLMDAKSSANAPEAAAAEENIRGVYAYVTDLKERVAKLQYQKQLLASRVLELERNDDDCVYMLSPEKWKSDLHVKRKQIFELWNICHVSVIHRSQFYLLFRGEPADAMYIEVELRRLLWLRDYHLKLQPSHRNIKVGSETQFASPGSSIRRLKKERESLVKYMRSGMTSGEREKAYRQWGIPLNAKQRKMRLAYMVWTNPHSEEHMRMSAELVGRLVGLWDSGPKVHCKEMFHLTFSPPSCNPTSYSPTHLAWFASRS